MVFKSDLLINIFCTTLAIKDVNYLNIMKKITLILIVAIWCQSTAQNLVPNPGFEDIIECPPAFPGNTKIHFAEPWIPVLSVDNSTSDLWHECVFELGNDPWGQLEFYGHYYTENPPYWLV